MGGGIIINLRDYRKKYSNFQEITPYRKIKGELFTIGINKYGQYLLREEGYKKFSKNEIIHGIIERNEIYILTKKDREFKIYSWKEEKPMEIIEAEELIFIAPKKYIYRQSQWDPYPIFRNHQYERTIHKEITTSLYHHFVSSFGMVYYHDFKEDPRTHQLRYLELGNIEKYMTSKLYGISEKNLGGDNGWREIFSTNQKKFSLLKKEPFSQKVYLIEYHFSAHQLTIYEMMDFEKNIVLTTFFDSELSLDRLNITFNPLQIEANHKSLYPPSIQNWDDRIKYRYPNLIIMEYKKRGDVLSEIIDSNGLRYLYKGRIMDIGNELLLY
ncbi:MAG: hypothetical protein Q4P28_00510 [Tissierellia bacterium]|nr:hypothetical protein [Tissierellia bacterium]